VTLYRQKHSLAPFAQTIVLYYVPFFAGSRKFICQNLHLSALISIRHSDI